MDFKLKGKYNFVWLLLIGYCLVTKNVSKTTVVLHGWISNYEKKSNWRLGCAIIFLVFFIKQVSISSWIYVLFLRKCIKTMYRIPRIILYSYRSFRVIMIEANCKYNFVRLLLIHYCLVTKNSVLYMFFISPKFKNNSLYITRDIRLNVQNWKYPVNLS